jgi:hypothetical protein
MFSLKTMKRYFRLKDVQSSQRWSKELLSMKEATVLIETKSCVVKEK